MVDVNVLSQSVSKVASETPLRHKTSSVVVLNIDKVHGLSTTAAIFNEGLFF